MSVVGQNRRSIIEKMKAYYIGCCVRTDVIGGYYVGSPSNRCSILVVVYNTINITSVMVITNVISHLLRRLRS